MATALGLHRSQPFERFGQHAAIGADAAHGAIGGVIDGQDQGMSSAGTGGLRRNIQS